MKIVGITVVRDEVDVVGHAVMHALAMGLDEVLVVDNGSTDGTSRLLHRIARRHGRVLWTWSDGPYEQRSRMNGLLQDAVGRGADWIVPFDADEFIICRGDLRRHLRDVEAPALRIRSHNLVPGRSWRRPRSRRTARMSRIARPWATQTDVETGRASWLELARAPKVVFRAARDAELATGQHMVRHPQGKPAMTPDLHMLHAPVRSWDGLRKRVERVPRHLAASDGPNAHWHLRRLEVLHREGQLPAVWRASSHRRGWLVRLDGSRVHLEPVRTPAWRRGVATFV